MAEQNGTMPEAVKQKLDELGANLHKTLTELEPRIKSLEDKGDGAADVKEEVNKISEANAKLIDTAKAELQEELNKRQDEAEKEIQRRIKAMGPQRGEPIAAPAVKAAKELRTTVNGGATRVSEMGEGERRRFINEFGAKLDGPSVLHAGRKTVTALEASAGDILVGEFERQFLVPPQQQITLLDVLPTSMTSEPIIYWAQEKLEERTTNVTTQSLDKQGTGQGTALGKSDFVFEQKSSEVRTIGTHAKAAIQILDDEPQMEAYIRNQLGYMVRYEVERQVLKAAGAGKEIDGINNQATAYNATLESDTSVTGVQRLDKIRVAALQVLLAHFAADIIVLNPLDQAALELIKDGESRYLWANPTSGNGIRPWGLPVVATQQQSQGDFTVFASNRVEFAMRRALDLSLATENEDDFIKLLVTFRAFIRGALKVYRPASIIHGSFGAVTS